MEHIVQIAFNFDDTTVTQHLMKTIEKKVEDDIRTAIIDAILEKRDWCISSHAKFGDPLKDWAKSDIKKFLEDNKDAIVEKAALAYAEHLKSSRTVRDKVIEKVSKEI